jgi:uncharacterized protein (TIGR00369 family)
MTTHEREHSKPSVGDALGLLKELSGLEFLKAIAEGRAPMAPLPRLLGFQPAEVDKGRAVFTATPGEEHYNPIGSVHGGYTAALLDTCMACAVHSLLPPGQGYTTLEFKVNFLRAISKDAGALKAEGNIIHLGRQTATAEGRITDSRDRLLAHATTTCLVFAIP